MRTPFPRVRAGRGRSGAPQWPEPATPAPGRWWDAGSRAWRAVLILAGSAAIFSAGGGRAAEVCAGAEGEPVWVSRVISGDEVELVDGRRVRLAAVEVPAVPLVADPATAREAEAVGRAARAALGEAVEGREIALSETGVDRHGRILGHLYDTEAGQWIEATLVTAGHLRVVPSRETRVCAAALLPHEAEARGARRGLWASATFAVGSVETGEIARSVGRFVVVEGRVRSVGRSGGRIWLNFGDDFRRDFAVVMKDNDLDRFRAAGFDATTARGRMLRVRGVVYHRDGPRIAVEVPEDIERVTR